MLEKDNSALGIGPFQKIGHFSDITIVSEATETQPAKKFRAHKLVLVAQSPVFETMFMGNFIEKEKTRIDVTESADVVEQMLKYLYEEPVNWDSGVLELLQVADKVSFVQLKPIIYQ